MRLTLEIPDEAHRQIKTLAAFHGMSMKDFILERTLRRDPPSPEASPRVGEGAVDEGDPDEKEEGYNHGPGKPEGMDETEWIMQNPRLVERLNAALARKERITFKSEEEFLRAVGL